MAWPGDPDTIILRTVQYGLANYSDFDKEGHWQRPLNHLHEKYAEGGYLKLWFENSPNVAHLNSDAQGNDKYPDGIFCAYPSGIVLGREIGTGNSEMKTFITYDMLRGERIDKGEARAKPQIIGRGRTKDYH